MLGAIIGDIVGSVYEFYPRQMKTTDFELITPQSRFTDDTVMTFAIAVALMKSTPANEKDFEEQAIKSMKYFGNKYPYAGYGTKFIRWLASDTTEPYRSYGNGSAMRVSPVAWAFDNLEDVEQYAAASARVTHNHPEGIKGAQSTAGAIFLARTGKSKAEIKKYVSEKYSGYNLDRTLAEIRPDYFHDATCQGSVPEAIIAFLEASDFESAIRNAVSLGGDADTQAAIAGSIAEGMWTIKKDIADKCLARLDDYLMNVLTQWQSWLNDKA